VRHRTFARAARCALRPLAPHCSATVRGVSESAQSAPGRQKRAVHRALGRAPACAGTAVPRHGPAPKTAAVKLATPRNTSPDIFRGIPRPAPPPRAPARRPSATPQRAGRLTRHPAPRTVSARARPPPRGDAPARGLAPARLLENAIQKTDLQAGSGPRNPRGTSPGCLPEVTPKQARARGRSLALSSLCRLPASMLLHLAQGLWV